MRTVDTVRRPMNRLLLLFLFFLSVAGVSGQQLDPPVYKPEHRAVLRSYEEGANDQAAKNLNRFAIVRLYRYHLALDSLYGIEKADSLKSIENAYLRATAEKQQLRKKAQQQITSFGKEKDELAEEYYGLLRKSAFAFLIWLTIVLLIMQFRRRKLKSWEKNSGTSDVRLSSLEERNALSDQLLNEAATLKAELEGIGSKLKDKLSKLKSDPGSNAEAIGQLEKQEQSIAREERILMALDSQKDYNSEDKVGTDINQLCDTYMEIAQRGFQNAFPEVSVQVSRDFEKKLPEIKVVPAAVGTLLMNVLSNAFQSVEEKSRQNVKGYQPKVSISTRILPRFLQIRVKDNGVGMNDEVLASATEEFFSTKAPEVAAGLGLAESVHVISTLHKGELKIESEKENSTDVYIKFFL